MNHKGASRHFKREKQFKKPSESQQWHGKDVSAVGKSFENVRADERHENRKFKSESPGTEGAKESTTEAKAGTVPKIKSASRNPRYSKPSGHDLEEASYSRSHGGGVLRPDWTTQDSLRKSGKSIS